MFSLAAFFGLTTLVALIVMVGVILRQLGLGAFAALIACCAALGAGVAVIAAVLSADVALIAQN